MSNTNTENTPSEHSSAAPERQDRRTTLALWASKLLLAAAVATNIAYAAQESTPVDPTHAGRPAAAVEIAPAPPVSVQSNVLAIEDARRRGLAGAAEHLTTLTEEMAEGEVRPEPIMRANSVEQVIDPAHALPISIVVRSAARPDSIPGQLPQA